MSVIEAVPAPAATPAALRVPSPGMSVLPVRRNVREAPGIFTLTLDPGPEKFPFAPGQFNMVYAFGEGEAPISVSGDPSRPTSLVHTIRAVGNVTRALQRLRRGDVVGVRGPFGTAWPVEAARGHDLVVIAGGIGLAPLRPVVHHVLARRSHYGRFVLLYGARTPKDLLYAAQLQDWRGRFDVEVEVTVDRSGPDWQGSVGVVTRLVPRAPFDPARTLAFVCGPEVMMRFAVGELLRRGVDEERIFVSLERNMKCGTRLCGHCQLGPLFVCHDGPVFPHAVVAPLLALREA